MRKRTLLKMMFALAVMGVATPVPRAAAEEEAHPEGRFVRWKNDDGTLNCYPGCELYKPCC